MKKKLITLLQIALGCGVLAFFFWKLAQSGKLVKFQEAILQAAGNWPLLAAGIGIFFVCLLLCAIRWNMLLKSQGVSIPFPQLLVLFFIGHFFSSLLPGAVSGDVFKAYYVARKTPDKKAEVVSTVFIDRIIGMLALLLLTVTMMATRMPFFLACKATRYALVFNLLFLSAAAAGMFIIVRHNLFEKWSFFSHLENKAGLGGVIRKAYAAFHVCLNHPGLLWKTISLSVINHVLFIFSAFLIGTALRIEMAFVDYLTLFPVINAIRTIPLTPGGLGTADAATVLLLHQALNVPEAKALAVSLLVYGAVLFWAMAGGIVYLVFVSRSGYDAHPEMKDDL